MKSEQFIPEEQLDEWSETHPNIKKEMKKKGYKYLGSGVDQTAYLEPGTGQVLKIFGTQADTAGSNGAVISPDQEMFVRYAKLCMKSTNNPFLPKFSGFEKFVFDDKTYFQIRQERLKEMDWDLGSHLEDIASIIETGYESTARGVIATLKREAKENDTAKWGPDPYTVVVKKFGEKNAHELIATMVALNKLANKNGYTFDLHGGNFLMRGKTPVIVDPWVHPSSGNNW